MADIQDKPLLSDVAFRVAHNLKHIFLPEVGFEPDFDHRPDVSTLELSPLPFAKWFPKMVLGIDKELRLKEFANASAKAKEKTMKEKTMKEKIEELASQKSTKISLKKLDSESTKSLIQSRNSPIAPIHHSVMISPIATAPSKPVETVETDNVYIGSGPVNILDGASENDENSTKGKNIVPIDSKASETNVKREEKVEKIKERESDQQREKEQESQTAREIEIEMEIETRREVERQLKEVEIRNQRENEKNTLSVLRMIFTLMQKKMNFNSEMISLLPSLGAFVIEIKDRHKYDSDFHCDPNFNEVPKTMKENKTAVSDAEREEKHKQKQDHKFTPEDNLDVIDYENQRPAEEQHKEKEKEKEKEIDKKKEKEQEQNEREKEEKKQMELQKELQNELQNEPGIGYEQMEEEKKGKQEKEKEEDEYVMTYDEKRWPQWVPLSRLLPFLFEKDILFAFWLWTQVQDPFTVPLVVIIRYGEEALDFESSIASIPVRSTHLLLARQQPRYERLVARGPQHRVATATVDCLETLLFREVIATTPHFFRAHNSRDDEANYIMDFLDIICQSLFTAYLPWILKKYICSETILKRYFANPSGNSFDWLLDQVKEENGNKAIIEKYYRLFKSLPTKAAIYSYISGEDPIAKHITNFLLTVRDSICPTHLLTDKELNEWISFDRDYRIGYLVKGAAMLQKRFIEKTQSIISLRKIAFLNSKMIETNIVAASIKDKEKKCGNPEFMCGFCFVPYYNAKDFQIIIDGSEHQSMAPFQKDFDNVPHNLYHCSECKYNFCSNKHLKQHLVKFNLRFHCILPPMTPSMFYNYWKPPLPVSPHLPNAIDGVSMVSKIRSSLSTSDCSEMYKCSVPLCCRHIYKTDDCFANIAPMVNKVARTVAKIAESELKVDVKPQAEAEVKAQIQSVSEIMTKAMLNTLRKATQSVKPRPESELRNLGHKKLNKAFKKKLRRNQKLKNKLGRTETMEMTKTIGAGTVTVTGAIGATGATGATIKKAETGAIRKEAGTGAIRKEGGIEAVDTYWAQETTLLTTSHAFVKTENNINPQLFDEEEKLMEENASGNAPLLKLLEEIKQVPDECCTCFSTKEYQCVCSFYKKSNYCKKLLSCIYETSSFLQALDFEIPNYLFI